MAAQRLVIHLFLQVILAERGQHLARKHRFPPVMALFLEYANWQ